MQVSHHPLDEHRLLEVLASERRHLRLDHVQQLEHDRRDAPEVSGTTCTLQNRGQALDLDKRRCARRI